MDIKSSDFILILNLEDIHGQKMRVADTAEFTVRVWTNDPTHYLTFKKRDIISDEYNDRIPIDRMQMECLASGTIIYDYDYSKWNADFSATDEKYSKVKTVVTDVYWRNVMNPGNPCNIINYQTIEHIYDSIEKERIEREKFANKLNDEIKRSTDVDIEMFKTIKDNKEVCDNRNTEITTKLNDEIKRSTAKDDATDNRLSIIDETKADKATTYTKAEVDDKIANFDGNVQLADYAKTADVDKKIEAVKADTATELGKKLDKTTYATDKLSYADKSETNTAIKTVSDNLTAETSRATEAENKIKTDLTSELNKKVATVTIEKDTTNDLQYHLLVDGEKSGEINIPKDQFLSNVVYSSDTKVITFTFETSTGTKTTDVNVADLVDTYSAGDGLTLVDNKFSVKKDDSSQSYIEVSASGVKIVGVNEALALKANSADVTTELNKKANSSDVYVKGDIDDKVTTLTNDLAGETSRATEAEGKINTTLNAVKGDVEKLKTNVQSNTDSLAIINGDAATNGSIAHSLSEAKHYTDDEVGKVKTTVATKANKTDVYTKAEVDEKIANFDGNVSLDGYAKTVDVDKKIADVKADTATELGKKVDKTAYATDKLSFADKTETNAAITTVSDNLTAETSRATGVEDGIKADVALKANAADVNTSLDKKLDKSTYTTDKATYALKSDVTTELSKKANSSDVYTQEQCDAKYMKMWQGSQSEYEAIDTKDNNTLYIIK